MPEAPIHQPHDKLFKASFGDPINAAAFLRREIPPGLAAKIDWEQLLLQPGSFIDSQFRHTQSDLLFSAPLADAPCLLYFLFEHQISQDPLLALRLLRYMVRIWEEWTRNHPGKKLPVIFPIVLAQNAKVWNISTQFSSLLDLPARLWDDVRPFVPDFTYRLIQLAQLPFSELHGTPTGIMTLRVMKAERLDDLLNHFVWDEPLILLLPQDVRERLLLYIIHGGIDIEAFHCKVEGLTNSELQTTAMSLAQQLHHNGRKEGIQNSVIEALEIRFEHVPAGLAEAIRGIHDEARLHSLLKAAIQAATLEAFTAAL